MLKSPISKSKKKKKTELLVRPDTEMDFFTFYDMDDTLVNLRQNVIKNAHLLLPILLFQTHSKNQAIGILTNRNRADEHTQDYKVADFIQNVGNFGIDIPQSHVRFGGGENAKKIATAHFNLEQAVATLTQQLSTLCLHQQVDDRIKSITNNMDFLIETKYMGKNFIITEFLNEHLQGKSYIFDNVSFPCDQLVIGIVDDLEGIPEATEALGDNFFGIKASRGGKRPEDLSQQSRSSEDDLYYSDQYLIKLADNIGMTRYLRSLRKNSVEHQNDPAMLKAAAFLYGLHATPKKINLNNILALLPELGQTGIIQLSLMVECIINKANTHGDACYRSMDELLNILRAQSSLNKDDFDDYKSLNAAQYQLKEIQALLQEGRTQNLHSQSDSALPKVESPASKKSFMGTMRTLSRKSRNRSLQSISESPLQKQFDQLLEQVEKISISKTPYIAKKARQILRTTKRREQAEKLASTLVRSKSLASAPTDIDQLSPQVLTSARELEQLKDKNRRKSAPLLNSSDESVLVEEASLSEKKKNTNGL